MATHSTLPLQLFLQQVQVIFVDVDFAERPPRYYCLSILDKHHHPDIDFEQGLKILRMCTDELKRRLPIDFKGVSSYCEPEWC